MRGKERNAPQFCVCVWVCLWKVMCVEKLQRGVYERACGRDREGN